MINKAIEYIKQADAILVTSANGLSITEGLNLMARGFEFINDFPLIYQKYGYSSLIEAFLSDEMEESDRYNFLDKVLTKYVLNYKPSKSMKYLKEIVKNKDYFLLSTNGETHFELSGFDLDKIYEIEGTWVKMQCENGCNKLYDTFDVIKKFKEFHEAKCDKCSGKLILNMMGRNFIENEVQIKNFKSFLSKYSKKNVVIIELGVGKYNNLIKIPIMRLIMANESYKYIVVNKISPSTLNEISDRTVLIENDIENALSQIANGLDL